MTSLTRSRRIELLDRVDEEVTPEDLAGNLRDIRRANRFFGGTRSVLSALDEAIVDVGHSTAPITLLDLATGSADIPAAIARRASRRGWSVQITATDWQPEIVEAALAAQQSRSIRVESADARDLPYLDDSFDVVLLSLALHHFEPADAADVLREMRRVAKRALIVSDLERSRAGLAGAWLFSRALTRNRLTRHDAPLSVRRAYTPDEALALARTAGWTEPRTRRVMPFRYVLTGRP
ncbi:MAG TPA: methyltransferase domain-containing protein [Thermomicrobiales bacterium]|nr:methyltransferase domain-containing protein [Thermomicrobiales bacterium]